MRSVELSAAQRALLESARRATLATIRPDGRPRLVPICFAVGPGADLVLYTPIDDKPKATLDVRALARVRDLEARPQVEVLVDRWSEDWTDLAWLRLDGEATLLRPCREHAAGVARLRGKYAQYAAHRLEERPLIRIEISAARGWHASPDG